MSDYLPVGRAAREVGLSASHVRRLAATGEIRATKLGTEWIVYVPALRAYVTGGPVIEQPWIAAAREDVLEAAPADEAGNWFLTAASLYCTLALILKANQND